MKNWTDTEITRLSRLVGRPYEHDPTKPGDGPDRFRCWGLVRYVWREFYGKLAPEIPYDAKNDLQCVRIITAYEKNNEMFSVVDSPRDGDLVVMGNGPYGRHVGVYVLIDRGLVVHADDNGGVMATALTRLPWTRIRFFRFNG